MEKTLHKLVLYLTDAPILAFFRLRVSPMNGENYVSSPMSVSVLMSVLLMAEGIQGDTTKEICDAIIGKNKKHTCTDDADNKEVVGLLGKIRADVETA
nr:hypothetical protein HmN_000357000 [Hymenolepis microstoma]